MEGAGRSGEAATLPVATAADDVRVGEHAVAAAAGSCRKVRLRFSVRSGRPGEETGVATTGHRSRSEFGTPRFA